MSQFRERVTMAMFLTLAVLGAILCLASNVSGFHFVQGSITVPERSARNGFLKSVQADATSQTFSRNKFNTSKPEQTGGSSSVRDNTLKTMYKKNEKTNVDTHGKDNQREEVMGKISNISVKQISNSRSGTNVKNNDTSAKFFSGSNVDNKFPKRNAKLNIIKFGELDHDILDKHAGDETQKLSTPLNYIRPRSDTGNQYNQPGFETSSKPVMVIPFTGHNNYRNRTSKKNDDDSNNECTCSITKCDCSSRGLTKIPQNLPTIITELLLNNNSINILPKNVLCRYQMLENLVLFRSGIHTIEEDAFNGLTSLISLDLSYNSIGLADYIPERIFEPLKSLKLILLEYNRFNCSSKRTPILNALAYLQNVEELKIDYYGEGSFGPEYNNMTSLRKLTLRCGPCEFSTFSNETFQHLDHITSLNISSCGINGTAIETDTFLHLRNLQSLDISNNPTIGMKYLSTILWSFKNSSLQTLNMSYIVSGYAITKVDKIMVPFFPQRLTTLVTRRNNILTIDNDVVRNLPKSLRVIDLNENIIVQNPFSVPLKELDGLETLFIHSSNDECLNNNEEYTVQSLCDDLNNQELKGSEQDQFLHSEISMKTGKLKKTLPMELKSVKINVRSDPAYFLDRINKHNNVQALDMSCSYLTMFYFCSLFALPNLKCLNMRKSSIEHIVAPCTNLEAMRVLILGSNKLNDFFTDYQSSSLPLMNLSYLDLSFNQISFVRQDFLKGLNRLEYLRLDGNSFSVFGADISNLTQLKLLNLSNTGLSQLSSEVRTHIDQLCKVKSGQVRVDISGCPIQCDCFNLDFLKWMVNSPAFDKNFTGYKCKYPDTSLKYINDSYQETIHVLDRECAKNYPLFLIVLAATSLFMFTVVGAVVYRFRWNIRYLYYAAYLKIMDKRKIDKQHEFTYDVFVSYDFEDQQFIINHLHPELEKRGLKLLIHSRDFVAGTYIASNIVMAVGQSRKTLVVLTRNLLESTWCNYEIQIANMEAVHTGRQVLVFLLKENILNSELELDLLRHIRSNTYIPYPGPEEEGNVQVMKRFYDKLTHDLKC